MDSCAMTRRVEVQRWPAVPTAPKKIARAAISRSADLETTSALFPPSSRMLFPSRPCTVLPTSKPIRVEPVAETSGTRRSSAILCPSVGPSPITSEKMAGSAPVFRQTRSAILITASAVSGVFSDGFQIVASPQTAARVAFHDQTATGKLKAEIIPITPSGCHCSIRRWLGRSD